MGALLDALDRLQKVETQLSEIRRRQRAKSRGITTHRKRLEALEAEQQAKSEEFRRQQMAADRIDRDVKTREAEIAKLRTALNTAKTNKEYSAILTQLNLSKADARKLEKEGLDALTKVDEIRAQRDEIAQQAETERSRLREVQAESDAVLRDTSAMADQLQAQRDQAAAGISSHILQLFERVAEHHDGQAMARVVRSHPKREEFLCDGCHMSVPLEVVNALRTKDEVQQCVVCGRLLYIEQPAATGSPGAAAGTK
jgi:predicted  nucleic acid-binding Zn-ribbon protein